MTTKPIYYLASFSGGKDSTAMVLHLIERGDPLDEVLFCDTSMEFPAMLRHVEKVKAVIENAGIKFTTLRAGHDFEHYLNQANVPHRKPGSKHFGVPGYGWPGPKNRWCTHYLKLVPVKDYMKTLEAQYELIQYIGLAADEDHRMAKKNNQNPRHRHPLRDWGWDEAQALAYCYEKGYDWENLYEIFKDEKTGRARVSCWCCPLQSYGDLRTLRKHFPDLWEKMLELDRSQWQTFAHGFSVQDFDTRFQLEDALTAKGEGIKNRKFFADFKRVLAGEATIDSILLERQEGEQLSLEQIKEDAT